MIAAKPSATDQAAIAIWVPTEKASTAVREGPVRVAASSACWAPGAPRGEGDDVGDRLDAHHQQDVAEGATDAEGLEEEPEGAEATEPADPLPGGDLAQVAARLEEDRDALFDPVPEGPHAVGEKDHDDDLR